MKKNLLLGLLIAIVLSYTSCKGDQGPMGPMGPAGADGINGEVTYFQTPDLTVKSEDWILSDDKTYYYYSEGIPEITEDVCNFGLTLAYIWWQDDGIQAQLPCVRHFSEEVKDENSDNTSTIYYTRTIDFEYQPGEIKFFVTNSDLYTGEQPDTYTFRIVCIL